MLPANRCIAHRGFEYENKRTRSNLRQLNTDILIKSQLARYQLSELEGTTSSQMC